MRVAGSPREEAIRKIIWGRIGKQVPIRPSSCSRTGFPRSLQTYFAEAGNKA